MVPSAQLMSDLATEAIILEYPTRLQRSIKACHAAVVEVSEKTIQAIVHIRGSGQRVVVAACLRFVSCLTADCVL